MRFGRLTAVRLAHMTQRGAYWACRCDCGNRTVSALADLRNGEARSCGCLRREALKAVARGKSTTKLTWADVAAIQARYQAGDITRAVLGRQYKVTAQTISNALRVQVPGSGPAPGCDCLYRESTRAATRAAPGAKLTWDDVAAIKAERHASGVTLAELGRKYRVSGQAVADALKAVPPDSRHAAGCPAGLAGQPLR